MCEHAHLLWGKGLCKLRRQAIRRTAGATKLCELQEPAAQAVAAKAPGVKEPLPFGP